MKKFLTGWKNVLYVKSLFRETIGLSFACSYVTWLDAISVLFIFITFISQSQPRKPCTQRCGVSVFERKRERERGWKWEGVKRWKSSEVMRKRKSWKWFRRNSNLSNRNCRPCLTYEELYGIFLRSGPKLWAIDCDQPPPFAWLAVIFVH